MIAERLNFRRMTQNNGYGPVETQESQPQEQTRPQQPLHHEPVPPVSLTQLIPPVDESDVSSQTLCDIQLPIPARERSEGGANAAADSEKPDSPIAERLCGQEPTESTTGTPQPVQRRSIDEDSDGNQLCAVCLVNASGAQLLPCGHDHFCEPCAMRFVTCPLCRVTLVLSNGRPLLAGAAHGDANGSGWNGAAARPLFSKLETRCLLLFACAVWLVLFIGGIAEWSYKIPKGCGVGCKDTPPAPVTAAIANYTDDSLGCCSDFDTWPRVHTDRHGKRTCGECSALVKPSSGRCDEYCSSFGNECVSAAEPSPEVEGSVVVGLSCEVYRVRPCDEPSAQTRLCKCKRPTAANPECSMRLMTEFEKRRERCEDGCTAGCQPGYFNAGRLCVKSLEDIPPVQTAAALGGQTYLVMIVSAQLLGAVTEVALIRRLIRREMMPQKEFFVVSAALIFELLRTAMVDVYVLQDYFTDRSFQNFRVPKVCDATDGDNSTSRWLGHDGVWYCYGDDVATRNHGDARYYIATHREAFSLDHGSCSTFPLGSALLDYDGTSGYFDISDRLGGGHPRYSRIGWVLGGEFALFYLFATVVNEVADNVFVVPTTAKHGLLFKLFSVVLEVFQLGTLVPAAIFSHDTDCLHYTDPLGVDLKLIRNIVVACGYYIWGFLLITVAVGFLFTLLRHDNPAVYRRLTSFMRRLPGRGLSCSGNKLLAFSVVAVLFLPLLLSGVFLGILVVVGQASKRGSMNLMTSIILVSDLGFKILATAITEAVDFALHLRVRRVIARREEAEAGGQNNEPLPQVLGRVDEPIGEQSSTPESGEPALSLESIHPMHAREIPL